MASAEYNGDELVIVCIVLLALTYLSVGLRCFVRVKLMNAFMADDWFMVVSQIVFTISCAFILRGVHYGIGQHNNALTQEDLTASLMYQALATLTYVANMMFIKLSICILLLRIASRPIYIWILRVSMVVVTIWSLAIFLYDIFQCTPIAAQWDFTLKNSHCVGTDSIVSAAYAISVMTILSDWLYALLPIPMIWNINMSSQTKSTVVVILSLGVFASIATLIRLRYLVDLTKTEDILYAGTNPMIWTLIEPGVAIIAASLITIRPLLRALRLRGFGSTDPSSNGPREGSHHLSLRNDEWSSRVERNQRIRLGDGDEESKTRIGHGTSVDSDEEYILAGDLSDMTKGTRIQKTVSVIVSREHVTSSSSSS
ncbi:integral membrane family protein [Phlyctema vagabunda]|uniref:Integral membrane family protein n=1 Tax=Phlyctema vagabunda TaxID=108571 RepID=A0ABR4PHN5_9HELO